MNDEIIQNIISNIVENDDNNYIESTNDIIEYDDTESTNEYDNSSVHSISENKCCICLDEMNDLHDTILLSCNHILHKKCLFSYIATNYRNEEVFNTCPLCRKYISTNIQSNINIVNVKTMTNSNRILLMCSIVTNVFFLSIQIFNLFR